MNELVSLSENILFRRVADEGVVVDQHNGKVIVVNEIVVRILELYRESGSLESVVDSIAAEYDATPDVIKSDAITLLKQINSVTEEG